MMVRIFAYIVIVETRVMHRLRTSSHPVGPIPLLSLVSGRYIVSFHRRCKSAYPPLAQPFLRGKSPGMRAMVCNENRQRTLENYFGNNFGNLRRFSVSDVDVILDYGWDPREVEEMIDNGDWEGISGLATWIRNIDPNGHGIYAEDDEPYTYPLDEDGNYLPGILG